MPNFLFGILRHLVYSHDSSPHLVFSNSWSHRGKTLKEFDSWNASVFMTYAHQFEQAEHKFTKSGKWSAFQARESSVAGPLRKA